MSQDTVNWNYLGAHEFVVWYRKRRHWRAHGVGPLSDCETMASSVARYGWSVVVLPKYETPLLMETADGK